MSFDIFSSPRYFIRMPDVLSIQCRGPTARHAILPDFDHAPAEEPLMLHMVGWCGLTPVLKPLGSIT